MADGDSAACFAAAAAPSSRELCRSVSNASDSSDGSMRSTPSLLGLSEEGDALFRKTSTTGSLSDSGSHTENDGSPCFPSTALHQSSGAEGRADSTGADRFFMAESSPASLVSGDASGARAPAHRTGYAFMPVAMATVAQDSTDFHVVTARAAWNRQPSWTRPFASALASGSTSPASSLASTPTASSWSSSCDVSPEPVRPGEWMSPLR